LVLADLKFGTIILPRSDSPKAISHLAKFEWFHKIDTENDTVTPEIDDVLLNAQKTFQAIDEVVKGLGIPLTTGIMEILFKGTVIKKDQYQLDDLKAMVEDLEKKYPSIIDKPTKLIKESEDTKRSLAEYQTIKDALTLVKKLDIDIGNLGFMTHFYTNLFIIKTSNFQEISRTLQEATIYKYELDSKEESAIIIIADSQDADKVLKVMRSFNSNPFTIPQGVSQIPSTAFQLSESKIKELVSKQKSLTKEIQNLTKKKRAEILAMHEKAYVTKEVLESLRKPGGTRSFSVIQGYIPAKMEKQFKKVTGEWMSVVEKIDDPKLAAEAPVLFQNPRFARTFEVITESQGIPRHGEMDPTPMIAIMWPIFYGLMFADVGHGLLLMGLGLLFKLKGQGNLARWGMLIAISGAAAAIAGVGQGEAFGFHIDHFEPFGSLLHEGGILHPISWIVGVISVAELTFEQVITILKVSIFLGIVHLLWAFALRIIKLVKDGHKLTVFTEAIPNVTLYGGIVVIMMCAIGSGYDVMGMYKSVHTEAVPWVTVFLGDWAQVWIISRIAIIITIASIVIMMIGGIMHNKRHPEEGGSMVNVIIEVLLGKSIECLAHTISYARIGIMLLVHAALLLTVNNSFESMGGWNSPAAAVLIIGGNIGIMMIEGLIVFIQALRLHLYEFFTKWYDGGGKPFRQILPEMLYNQLLWKK
jgi:V/A-type H+-transporting ATPase subunit I|tara:strand:+ start:13262 stop:15358 length:2097 start_codon:yes stop_codon:yes gene_type:complete